MPGHSTGRRKSLCFLWEQSHCEMRLLTQAPLPATCSPAHSQIPLTSWPQDQDTATSLEVPATLLGKIKEGLVHSFCRALAGTGRGHGAQTREPAKTTCRTEAWGADARTLDWGSVSTSPPALRSRRSHSLRQEGKGRGMESRSCPGEGQDKLRTQAERWQLLLIFWRPLTSLRSLSGLLLL